MNWSGQSSVFAVVTAALIKQAAGPDWSQRHPSRCARPPTMVRSLDAYLSLRRHRAASALASMQHA
jgi:hypothetical protein